MTLPCVASGNPVPEVHWYKSDLVRTQIQKSSKYNLQPDGSLTLYNVEKKDSGLYVCEVSNTAGIEKAETSLIIRAPLVAVVRITTDHQEVELGSSVTLSCEISGYPVHRLEWRHNMRPLSSNGGIRHSGERAIRLRSLTKEDEGVYQCFVSNDVDSGQGSQVLVLKSVKPKFLETFREEIVYPSSDISLKCVAQGQPLPKITWTLNKQVIPESRRVRQGDFVTEKDTVHSYVNITQAELGDGGDFTCIAENDGGKVASVAPVKIYGPPTALPPRDRTIIAGATEHFKCPVAGYPLVTFSWKKGKDVLPSSSRHTLKDTGEFVLHAAHKSVDEGSYICTAWGPNGDSADGVVNLRVA
ncbi:Down syndrome cell adhesion molecule-like, partial [Limulus polyphemus]|uniref:Down syndrome cell adhesion molecule-like n=1 Tax=Limulus polyphemus TaxID=6850 RepID=A0ABM1RXB7_LIMPO